MKMITMLAALCLAAGASAQDAENDTCPVSGRAVAASAPTATHNGHTVGFCCGGCVGAFMAWDEQRKNGFVLTLASQPMEEAPAAFEGDPYVLGTCPISGAALGEGAVAKKIEGREVRFCCGGCPAAFEASRDEKMAALNKKMIEDQMPYYPLTTCIVAGEPLFEDGEDVGTNAVIGNRLVRVCCSACKKKVMADPSPYIAKLDKAVKEAQRDAYPVTTCPISGGELGHMGEPTEIVVANRLVRFCCGMCDSKLVKNPTAFIAELDKAWMKAGKPWAAEKKDGGSTSGG